MHLRLPWVRDFVGGGACIEALKKALGRGSVHALTWGVWRTIWITAWCCKELRLHVVWSDGCSFLQAVGGRQAPS